MVCWGSGNPKVSPQGFPRVFSLGIPRFSQPLWSHGVDARQPHGYGGYRELLRTWKLWQKNGKWERKKGEKTIKKKRKKRKEKTANTAEVGENQRSAT